MPRWCILLASLAVGACGTSQLSSSDPRSDGAPPTDQGPPRGDGPPVNASPDADDALRDASSLPADGSTECIECHVLVSGDGDTEEGALSPDAASCGDGLSAAVNAIKKCTINGDCTLADETLCCAVVIGIRAGTEQTLANTLQAFYACGPTRCGATACLPGLSENGITRRDDGSVGTIFASCDNGLCMSHVK
jgi:hypothetical protein